MANTDGQVVLGLNKPGTVRQINDDIKKLQNQLAKVKAAGALDTNPTVRKINAQIAALQSQLRTININAQIDRDSANRAAQQAGRQIGQNLADAAQQAIDRNNINTDKLNADIKTLTNNLNNFSSQNAGFDSFKTEINGVEVSLDSLINKLNTVDNAADLSTIQSQAAALKTAFETSSRADAVKLSMDNGHGASDYQNRINSIIASLEQYGVETNEAQNITAALQSTFDRMKGLSGQELVTEANKLEQEFNAVKASVEEAKLSHDKFMQPVSNEKAASLINRINSILTESTNISEEARKELQGYADELGKGVNLSRWNEINGKLNETQNSMSALGRLGAFLKDQMSKAAQSFTGWLSVSSAVSMVISKTKDAVSELKEVNTLLTQISKANDKLSKSDLDRIGNNSFDIAGRYGIKATDYLSEVQEASLAGYKNAEAIAELSVAAQAIGDLTAELADQYLTATDDAYKFGGSVKKLTEVLDGSNYITNRNAVNMTELAESMSIVSSTAASFGVDVNEATAALGTMIATTKQSGSEAAEAFKAILLNIRQVSDEEAGIDAKGLKKYENACNALNVRLKETRNGVLSLRDPMEVLKELSIEYNKLKETDIRRTDLLSSLGSESSAAQLDALLSQWSDYETMLQQYAAGTGSMAAEAEKITNSWEGSMNRLSNTWTDTIENIVDSDAVITIINALNSLLSVVNNVTDKLGSFGTIGLGGLGVSITAFVKNFA